MAWFAMPCSEPPPKDVTAPGNDSSLDAQLDLAAVDRVLQGLTPLDALRGGIAAALFATRLTVSGLLRRSGPVLLRGEPDPRGAQVELRWPLH